MRFLISLLFLVFVTVPTSLYAEEPHKTFVIGENPYWLTLNKGSDEFQIISRDQVDQGCWTSASATKTAVALELQRSGFKVNVIVSDDDKVDTGPRLYLSALGTKTTQTSCAVSYQMRLMTIQFPRAVFDEEFEIFGLRREQLWEQSGLLVGPKSSMSSRLKEAFITLAQRFLLDTEKRQQSVLEAVQSSALNDKEKEPASYEYWSQYEIK